MHNNINFLPKQLQVNRQNMPIQQLKPSIDPSIQNQLNLNQNINQQTT